ncbi:autotransporter domain-containing protein [Sphingobium aquiterrae]|uniref:autotransporter domain-containing protein n=1 Tax=Sphingobium aquiterrae TaxID=2038656 RepID=UPI003018CB3F
MIIADGATVSGNGLSAIRLNSDRANLRIDGTITATGAAALTVQNGIPYYNTDPYAGASPHYGFVYPNGAATIVVGEQGKISGDTGIWIEKSSSNPIGRSTASISNSGLITSTGGSAAIRGPASNDIYYSQIANAQTGTITGIAAGVFNISNAGMIDGGANAAIALNHLTDLFFLSSTSSIANSGTIASSSAATIDSRQDQSNISNSGSIENKGAGFAILATGGLSLTNSGTIKGSIQTGGASASLVDNSLGTIEGDVLFGSGDDIFVASIDTVGIISTGVTGKVDGAAGINMIKVAVAQDSTASGPLVLPTNFSVLGVALQDKARLTLDTGFSAAALVSVTGSGTLENQGRIETRGRAIAARGFASPDPLGVVNGGTIKAGLQNATDAAIFLDGASFTNDGMIEATGGVGIFMQSGSGSALVNSGKISASDGPAILFGDTFGSGRLAVENKTGGVIEGASAAIAIVSGSNPYAASATGITNAGTINGNVDLTGRSSADRFIMQQGGAVHGDVRLGEGDDIFIADGAMGADGFRTGISGALDGGAGNDQLVARFRSDADVVLGDFMNFEAIGLEVAAGKVAKMGGSLSGNGLAVFGEGTADLSLTIDAKNHSLITGSSYGFNLPDSPSPYDNTSTAIISRGVLNAEFDASANGGAGVALDQTDRFTNDGTITLVQAPHPYGLRIAAIGGGSAVTNNGRIILDGGAGIVGSLSAINSGTISQISGGATAVGVSGVRDLTNSGTIKTAGVAVGTGDSMPSTVRNSGTIAGSGAQAIMGSYSPVTIVNETGGTISGGAGFDAVALAGGGALSNAGTINGNVNLAYSAFGGTSMAGGAYVDRGGTLNGNLTFGAGNDIFVATGDTTGVLGTLNAGAGTDTYVRSYNASGSVDLAALPTLPVGFERRGVGASGANTVVTLTASSGQASEPIMLVGDGTIVNMADIATAAGLRPRRLVVLGTAIDPLNLSGAGSTLAFINRGTIGDGVIGYARSFDNEGTVLNRVAGNVSAQIMASDANSFTFRNSGTISSPDNSPYYSGMATAVTIEAATSSLMIGQADIENSGAIEGGIAVALNARQFTFANSGTIARGNGENVSASIDIGQGYGASDDINADSVTIDNSGTFSNGLSLYAGAKAISVTNSGIVGSSSYGGAISLTQYGHWTGDATMGLYGNVDQDSVAFANGGTVNGGANILASARTLTVTNSGTVDAAATTLAETDGAALEIESSSQGSQTINLTNSGTIKTDRLGVSAVSIEGYARSVDQQIHGYDESAGPGDGEPTTSVSITNSGVISADGGALHEAASPPPYPWYPATPESLQLVTALGINASSGGVSSITVTNAVGGLISATGATRNAGDLEGTPLAGFEDIGSTAFMASANRVTLVNAGTIRGLNGGVTPSDLLIYNDISDYEYAGRFMAGAIQTVNSADTITNLATGVISGSVDLGAMDDSMVNLGTINGNVFLGEGNDSFTHNLHATLNGMVDGGAGTDALVIDINGGGLLDQATFDTFVNFESQALSGTGTITTNGQLAVDSLFLRDAHMTLAAGQTLQTASDIAVVFADGTNSFINMGTIKGGLSFAGGTNSFVNMGNIAGPVTLGGGNDIFTIGAGSLVSGPVDAGAGNDLLILAAGGSGTSPDDIRLSAFTGFERTRQDSGTVALSGDYTTGQLDIVNGRFIGRTGSVLNAPLITVNGGATFGSAGTVNGNVTVQGTLSPGASPGTMTINGGVALAGGSTTLFEMTPTVSDALIINGSLAIAPGATLTLIGNRPLTPGVTYRLITASNGITGSFTTIDQASTVIGFIRQGSQSIDLLGQFVVNGSANPQVVRTVDYLNGLLIAGTATGAILDAAPSLLMADGSVNAASIARLNAESYASASQIGVENGLTIAAALRSANVASHGDAPGLFTFGQTLGGWRRLPGAAATGTSRADISTYGAFAGIGLGSQTASIGAFAGYINARQRIAALGTKTQADGVLAGVFARATFDGFEIAASLSYDGSAADTDRTLFNGSRTSAHYRLRGWTTDLSLGRSFAIGGGWSLRPEVGLTQMSSRRGRATENGDGTWGLTVDARRTKASFLNGAFTLKGATAARISPWLSVGIRHQLSDTHSAATAAYIGVPDSLTVIGVTRNATLATVGAGATMQLSRATALFFGANSEFGADSSGESATVGLKIRF